ncbi:MAG: hypothetical protein ABH950_04085 [Candidatus Altiarchaeota archaeon]
MRKKGLIVAGVLGGLVGLFWTIISWIWLLIKGLGGMAQSQPSSISFIEKIIFLPVFVMQSGICDIFEEARHVTSVSFVCILSLPFISSILLGIILGICIYLIVNWNREDFSK